MLDEKSIWEGKHIVEIVESLGTDEKLMVNCNRGSEDAGAV